MATFEEFLNERNITLKRRYTEAHPAKTAGGSARVRNAIIEALKDGKITVEEFNNIVSQHSSAPSKWTRGNKRFFKIEEDGVSLSKYGTKILNSLVTESAVNEKMSNAELKKISKTKEYAEISQAIRAGQEDYEDMYDMIDPKMFKGLDLKKFEEILDDWFNDEGMAYDSYADFARNAYSHHVAEITKLLMPYNESVSVDEGLNKSDVAYQLAIDYTGRTKPKITKLNKKRIQIKYGYKISPQKVIDSIKTVHPEVELKHVEWSDSMTGGGFHIFDILESVVTEARYDKKKLLKRLGDADDATIQTGDGKEYIIYNPNSNNKDNAAMWHDKSVFAVDQDGDEHEIDYKDIGLVMTESVNEAKLKFKVGDFIKMKKGGALSYEIKSIDPKFDSVEVYQDVTGQTTNYTIKHINKDWKLAESVNEARVDAKKLLKSVVNGETNSVEGIKLSKEMAQSFLDWLDQSTYGRKFSKLPFDKLFTAAFNWGIERYAKSGKLKGELKDLKVKAKAMKESNIYESFSEFELNETFTAKLTGIARIAKNLEDFIKRVFKHEKFKAFNTPKTQPDSYKNFLNFIKGHYEMVLQYESNKIEENMLYTRFTDFVNESLEINEALKSSKLRGLLTMNKGNKQLLKAIYGFSKIALDKITDDQIIDIDPKTGKKAEGLVVYYTTQEKKNPYADTSRSSWNSAANIPANTILAMGMGKDVAYVEGIFDRKTRKMSYTLTTDPRKAKSDIGINKEYRGWDASGIYNVKRVIDVADAAFVINPEALPDTKGKIADRVKAKEGALSFKSDKEFKDANLARYREILQKRASELPLDKLVMDAIDDATNVMKDGLKNQEKNKYGELIAGVGKDGRAYKLNDISNFISNLISDYERWSGYMKTIEDAEAKYGKDSREYEWEAKYAQKEAQEYAKSIKDRLDKLKKRNLAW